MFKIIKYLVRPTVFKCKIVNAKVVKKSGKISQRQMSSFVNVAKSEGIKSIVVYCYKSGDRERLDFSRAISEATKQKFRNGWVSNI